MLPDGRTVVNLLVRTPEAIGLPLHLLATNGSLERSFGSETRGAYRPDFPGMNDRALAVHTPSQVWAAHQRAYVIELIDVTTGTLRQRIVREAPWLSPTERQAPLGATVDIAPPSRIASIHQDENGRLWILISVADARWRTAVKAGEPRHVVITDPVKYTDMIIDVIDPARGELIASQRFDDTPPWFVGSGFGARFASTAADVPVFIVGRLDLVAGRQ
jgi:hypothetical protein